jgi:hypothetical protein
MYLRERLVVTLLREELFSVLSAAPLVRSTEHVYSVRGVPSPPVRSDVINLVTISAALRQW